MYILEAEHALLSPGKVLISTLHEHILWENIAVLLEKETEIYLFTHVAYQQNVHIPPDYAHISPKIRAYQIHDFWGRWLLLLERKKSDIDISMLDCEFNNC